MPAGHTKVTAGCHIIPITTAGQLLVSPSTGHKSILLSTTRHLQVWPALSLDVLTVQAKSNECPVAVISTPTTESTLYAKPLFPLSEAGIGNNRKELCGLYNSRAGNRCHFKPCKYLHICAICHEYGHPASTCKYSGLYTKQPMMDSKPPRKE